MLGPGHPPGYLGLAIVPSGLFGLGTERWATLRVIWAWLLYCTLRVIWAGHPLGYFSAEPTTRLPPAGYLDLTIVPSGLFGLGTLWVISLGIGHDLCFRPAPLLRAGPAGPVIWGFFGDQ